MQPGRSTRPRSGFYARVSLAHLAAILLAVLAFGSCRQPPQPLGRRPAASIAPAAVERTSSEKGEYGDLLDGDIVFQSLNSLQSQAIQIATKSSLTHVGLLYWHQGVLRVYEAIGPVTSTPFQQWVARGIGGHAIVKRLKNRQELVSPRSIDQMRRSATRFLGRPYDFGFGWSDDRIYCSELVWKVYKEGLGVEVGKLQRLGDYDLSHPLVQARIRERYGSNVPLDELVISPGAIADSELLENVWSTYGGKSR